MQIRICCRTENKIFRSISWDGVSELISYPFAEDFDIFFKCFFICLFLKKIKTTFILKEKYSNLINFQTEYLKYEFNDYFINS